VPGFLPQTPVNQILSSDHIMQTPLRDSGALRWWAFTTIVGFLGGHVVQGPTQ
jgi:hypothetical protein